MIQRIKVLVFVLIFLFSMVFASCIVPVKDSSTNEGGGGDVQKPSELEGNQESSTNPETEEKPLKSGTVNFIDVGNGECILINFPDGKNMLIDCGASVDLARKKVTAALDKLEDKRIDFFLLSHPDEEHIGNALYILKNYDVKKVYLPKILKVNLSLFPLIDEVIKYIEENEILCKESDYYDYINGEGYSAVFLTPKSKQGSYDRLNKTPTPSKANVNDVSPIIYLDVYGTRFVLTADAGKIEEETVISLNEINFYNQYLSGQGINVNLEQIDFLKVSDSGDDAASSQEFLDLLKPKNAIILVSGNNYLGLPSTYVLKRLQLCNEDYRLYRTDVCGDVLVTIKEDKTCTIKTQSD